LRRHGLNDPWRIRQARRWCAVRYVVFDVLYNAGRCLLHEPLTRRPEVLAKLCQRLDAPAVRFSEAVIGVGTALYAVVAEGHEGVMAKHLASRYRPGKRSAAWRKIKLRPRRRCSAREVFSY
jgi:ATP-dependent DNA ligase